MSLKSLLFPSNSRFFPGQRWANICLRTLHLVGLAGLGGGFLYPAAGEHWRIYLDLVVYDRYFSDLGHQGPDICDAGDSAASTCRQRSAPTGPIGDCLEDFLHPIPAFVTAEVS